MDEIILVKEPILLEILKSIANENDSDLVKAVVDIKLQIIAIGGYMHADEERLLLEEGSMQDNLWGINIYPDKDRKNWIEFDSMINIRSRQNNRSRGVEDLDIQKKIIEIVDLLIKQ
jgi:hypothetical protein